MHVVGHPNIDKLALHHTAVSRTNTQLDAVNRYHKNKWGMRSQLGWYVGYNFFCDIDGTITQTRTIGEETVANRGHNCDVDARCDTVSFCFAGNFNKELPSDAQIEAFKRWYKQFSNTFEAQVVGHRDIQDNRTCPGVLMTDAYIQKRLLEKPQYPDAEDAKKKEIAELYRQLDTLRALLRRLISKLK